MLNKIQQNLLKETTGIHEVPQGAYSLRINGKLEGKNSSENIEIVKKSEKEITNVDILRRLSQLEKYIYDKEE